jgi:hypothetical protein
LIPLLSHRLPFSPVLSLLENLNPLLFKRKKIRIKPKTIKITSSFMVLEQHIAKF